MIKSLLILILLLSINIYSHPADSLNNGNDSLKITSTNDVIIDSLLVSDSLKVENEIVNSDSLLPIQEMPVSNVTNIISKRIFLFENYRYTGDFLRPFQLNFVKDLAFLGQPNESFIYGAGYGGISFLEDGLFQNDRYTNNLNLNETQSEDIDSIEIIPSPRGFLFGPVNNSVAVNFIMNDFISPEPYTRLRYYEGPDGEAMIDGKFNARIYRRWNLSFQVTNRASDDRYNNTGYSMWQTNAKIKYFLSNKINISAIYQSVDSEIGLNGGVDIERIAGITNDINSELYDQQTLYVKYENRTQKVLNHNFRLKTQLLPWNNAKADLSFFYRYNKNEIRNDQDTLIIIDRYNNKNYGVAFNFNQELNIFSLQVLSTYEKNSTLAFAGYLSDSGNDLSIDHDYFSVSAVVSANLAIGIFIPSVFYKHSNRSIISDKLNQDKNGSGIGIDLTAKPLTFLSIYAGYSINDQFGITDSKSFEIGSTFNNGMILADVKFFSRNNFIPFNIRATYNHFEPKKNSVKGLGALVSLKLWKLLFETNTSYYYDLQGSSSISLPEVQFTGGIYLNDYFFDENLLLKTGFKFYYTGKLYAQLENSEIIQVEPSNKVDFTLVGEIKKVAIVYFIWENLAGNNYFITPYYPMPQRNIRFGLSWELFN